MYNIRAQAHLVNDGRFEVDEDGSGHMLPGPSLVEERTERVVVRTHLRNEKNNHIGPQGSAPSINTKERMVGQNNL